MRVVGASARNTEKYRASHPIRDHFTTQRYPQLLAECARRHGICVRHEHGVALDGAAAVHGAAGREPAAAQAVDYDGDDRRARAVPSAGDCTLAVARLSA